MTDRDHLPDDAGYIVLPRRIAIGGIAALLVATATPAISIYVSDQQQERRITELERRLTKAEDRAETDRLALADMKADIRVIRQILETQSRPVVRP